MPEVDRADDEDILLADPIITPPKTRPSPPPGPVPKYTPFISKTPDKGEP
jgi:hypothetical protein